MELIHLTDIPEEALKLIESATKGGASIFMHCFGQCQGQVKTAFLMRDTYRLYIQSDKGAGEHRYSKEQADDIYLSIS